MKKLALTLVALASIASAAPNAAYAQQASGTAALEHGKCRFLGIEYTCPRYERRFKQDFLTDQGRPSDSMGGPNNSRGKNGYF